MPLYQLLMAPSSTQQVISSICFCVKGVPGGIVLFAVRAFMFAALSLVVIYVRQSLDDPKDPLWQPDVLQLVSKIVLMSFA